MCSFAAVGAENSEKIDENSDKEMEVEESPEKIRVQTAPKVEEEQDLKVCINAASQVFLDWPTIELLFLLARSKSALYYLQI